MMSSMTCNGVAFAASAAAYAAPAPRNVCTNSSWRLAICRLKSWNCSPCSEKNAETAADTSSPAAAATCVVGEATAALAAPSTAPMRANDPADDANASGTAITYATEHRSPRLTVARGDVLLKQQPRERGLTPIQGFPWTFRWSVQWTLSTCVRRSQSVRAPPSECGRCGQIAM